MSSWERTGQNPAADVSRTARQTAMEEEGLLTLNGCPAES